jgi:hypothetical protein
MMRLLLVVLLLASCSSPALKGGEIHVSGRDTFQVHLDTQYVTSSTRISPRNITEEASPKFRTTTNKDTFESNTPYTIGTPRIITRLEKITK